MFKRRVDLKITVISVTLFIRSDQHCIQHTTKIIFWRKETSELPVKTLIFKKVRIRCSPLLHILIYLLVHSYDCNSVILVN